MPLISIQHNRVEQEDDNKIKLWNDFILNYFMSGDVNSISIIVYSFGFIVHACSIIILDKITHMFGDY